MTSKPRPYRVYKRVLGTHRYEGCYASFEAAEREARIVGGYVSVRSIPVTGMPERSSADSLSLTERPHPTHTESP